jgi:hypothetical protein
MRSMQCAVQTINNMAFSVEKRVLGLKQPRVNRATDLDVQHRKKIFNTEVRKKVQTGRKCKDSKRIRWSIFVAEVTETLNASPRKLLRKLAQQTVMSYSSCLKSAKTLHLFPYKVKVIQQLLPPDCEKRRHYYELLLAKLEDDPHMLDVTFVSDEVCFHFTGYVNSDITCIWSTKNLHAVHENSLLPVKI